MDMFLAILHYLFLGLGVVNVYIGADKYIFTTKPNYKRLIIEEVILFSIAVLVFYIRLR